MPWRIFCILLVSFLRFAWQTTSALANIPKINDIIVPAANKEIKRIAIDLLDVNIIIHFHFDEIIKVGSS